MTVRLIFILTFFGLTSTFNNHKTNKPSQLIAILDTIPEKQTFEILCDSVYKNKNYKIIQDYYPDGMGNDIGDNNTIFTFTKSDNSNIKIIFNDTLYSRTGEIEFRDFNGDNVKDILVQNISDVRSNWTYYLYLVDTTHDKLKKIKGFEEIKNPNYLPQYNLIDNYVMSGKNWTSFYKLQADSIKDFGIVIYDDRILGGSHADNEQATTNNYDREYRRAINSIISKSKNNR